MPTVPGGFVREGSLFLRLLLGDSPALIDDGLWDTLRNATTRYPLFCSQEDRVFSAVARNGGEQRCQRQELPLARLRGQDGRLMIEST